MIQKHLAVALAASVLLATVPPPARATTNDADLGFESAFQRPFYKKRYFGMVITGASIVAAGTFTYFTAGAGAPVAATGVSTVASWVAGGGAGSYMAGLSTVGGWFGGNAMVGHAILSGLSLGTVGGMSSWGGLSASQKVLALGATAATAMDGIAIIANPATDQLEWRVILPIPVAFADERMKKLLEELEAAQTELADASSARDEARAGNVPPSSAKRSDIERSMSAALTRWRRAVAGMDAELRRARLPGTSNRQRLLMAVYAQNAGRSEEFRAMLSQIPRKNLLRSSYFDYLDAIALLQSGQRQQAILILERSRKAAPFAIEPALLLVGVLGSGNFVANEGKIKAIATDAKRSFDSDAYQTPASLVSLNYRVGTAALSARRCSTALEAFHVAQKELSLMEKYWSGTATRNLIDLGEANALHCLGKRTEGHERFKAVWERTDQKDARSLLCEQYAGGCAK